VAAVSGALLSRNIRALGLNFSTSNWPGSPSIKCLKPKLAALRSVTTDRVQSTSAFCPKSGIGCWIAVVAAQGFFSPTLSDRTLSHGITSKSPVGFRSKSRVVSEKISWLMVLLAFARETTDEVAPRRSHKSSGVHDPARKLNPPGYFPSTKCQPVSASILEPRSQPGFPWFSESERSRPR
jgi:hypothetical protein